MTPARCFEWPSVYVHCYITPPPSCHEGHISMRVLIRPVHQRGVLSCWITLPSPDTAYREEMAQAALPDTV